MGRATTPVPNMVLDIVTHSVHMTSSSLMERPILKVGTRQQHWARWAHAALKWIYGRPTHRQLPTRPIPAQMRGLSAARTRKTVARKAFVTSQDATSTLTALETRLSLVLAPA